MGKEGSEAWELLPHPPGPAWVAGDRPVILRLLGPHQWALGFVRTTTNLLQPSARYSLRGAESPEHQIIRRFPKESRNLSSYREDD